MAFEWHAVNHDPDKKMVVDNTAQTLELHAPRSVVKFTLPDGLLTLLFLGLLIWKRRRPQSQVEHAS